MKTFGDMSVPLILLSVGLSLDLASLVSGLSKAVLVTLLRLLIGPE